MGIGHVQFQILATTSLAQTTLYIYYWQGHVKNRPIPAWIMPDPGLDNALSGPEFDLAILAITKEKQEILKRKVECRLHRMFSMHV